MLKALRAPPPLPLRPPPLPLPLPLPPLWLARRFCACAVAGRACSREVRWRPAVPGRPLGHGRPDCRALLPPPAPPLPRRGAAVCGRFDAAPSLGSAGVRAAAPTSVSGTARSLPRRMRMGEMVVVVVAAAVVAFAAAAVAVAAAVVPVGAATPRLAFARR